MSAGAIGGIIGLNIAMTGNPFDFSWMGHSSGSQVAFLCGGMLLICVVIAAIGAACDRKKPRKRKKRKKC